MKKLIVLVAAMVLVATSAYAAEWNFYGSARVSTFWNSIETTAVPAVADVDAFTEALQGNARIGANVKVSDELTGRFEYGSGPNLRLLYGTWNFGGGSLTVGQTYTPLCMFYSNQVYGADSDLLGWGGVYSGRQAVLQLQYGSFKVALTPANTGLGATFGAPTTEVKMPALEASYSLKLGNIALALAGGYQTFEVTTAPAVTYDVDSYVIALGASVNFGAVYINGDIWTGQNASNLIWADAAGTNVVAGLAGTTVLDNDAMGYLIVLGGKINDMFSVEFGYAGLSAELDAALIDEDSKSYYAQATINLAPGVSITPEIGVIDHDGTAVNKETYFGEIGRAHV